MPMFDSDHDIVDCLLFFYSHFFTFEFMKLFFRSFFFFALILSPFLLSPLPVDAALVPCGRSADDLTTTDVDESGACTLCHVLIGGQGLISWGMGVMVIIGIALIMISGVVYIVSVGDSGRMTYAKGMIGKVLGGLALILCGWLIMNTIITVLSSDDMGIGVQKTNWYTFTCDSKSTANTGVKK